MSGNTAAFSGPLFECSGWIHDCFKFCFTFLKSCRNIHTSTNETHPEHAMSFIKWYEEADMPEKVNGKWVDLETGIPCASATPKFTMSSEAKSARAIAKFFGGKALAGTARQKNWAEKIRAEKIQNMDADAAVLIVDPNGLCVHSKFWIENRAKSAAEFEKFVTTQKSLLKKHRSAGTKNERAVIAGDYNALTSKWGL